MTDIELWMVFEAVGPEKSDIEDSLDDHLEKMESEEGLKIKEANVEEVEKVQDPHPGLDEGYSQVAEVRADAETFTRAVKTVINYGPTYVQIEGSESFEMELPDLQDGLQEVANMMHQYAQMGVGGVLVSNPEEES
ncbi:MAG: hypothetical protein ABEJ36_01520 [Candidatus Nanosalina sp.]